MPKYVRGVFIMWKKILISIGLIIILIASIEIFNISKRNTNEEKNNLIVERKGRVKFYTLPFSDWGRFFFRKRTVPNQKKHSPIRKKE